MKLSPTQARNKVQQHLNQGNGIYIDCRYYDVRVSGGQLQVWAHNFWFDVAPGAEFRNSHGRTLFIYEPTGQTPAAPVEVLAAQEVELIDVDALFSAEAVAYSCEHTEDVGMPGNCEGCTFCRGTDAAVTAPLVTTRATALSVLCDDIATAETGVERRRASLSAMVQRGVDQPHDHARLAFDNAAIDIMWHQHAALLGRSLDDRA